MVGVVCVVLLCCGGVGLGSLRSMPCSWVVHFVQQLVLWPSLFCVVVECCAGS